VFLFSPPVGVPVQHVSRCRVADNPGNPVRILSIKHLRPLRAPLFCRGVCRDVAESGAEQGEVSHAVSNFGFLHGPLLGAEGVSAV
jgi:hypothetical protein